MPITQHDIPANGLTFHCREAGPHTGEPVILLHGFPETSHMWMRLMPKLADAGYHCLAPDQRGYSPLARPDGVDNYRYEDIAADVVALAGAWGAPRFHLVGHDWGALCGWAVVDLYPDRVASWTAMSVPHAKAFATAVRDDPEEEPYRQLLQLFVTPGVPETAAAANDFAMLRNAWSASDAQEVDAYLSVFRQPGAMTGALNWYRASRAHARSLEDAGVPFGPVSVPSQLIWGNKDDYIRRMSVDLAAPYMKGPYRVVEIEAGHWLAQEKPAEVLAATLEHLRANPLR
jgi:pimeloyl-ACP methyl ester carboxylesterase